jgi:hypothetical protein
VLGVAMTLEAVAFGAIFGFGGVPLGLAILASTGAVLFAFLAFERREARRLMSRQVWRYYAVNDRLSPRAQARRLATLDRSRNGAGCWLASGLHAGRLPGWSRDN